MTNADMPQPASRPARWKIASVVLIALVCVILGVSRLSFDTDVLNLLPDAVLSARGLKEYEQSFANRDEVIIALRGSDSAVTERLAANLATALSQQTGLVKAAVHEAPWERNPAEMADLAAFLWLNEPATNVEALIARLEPERLDLTLSDVLQRLGSSMTPRELMTLSYDPLGLLTPPSATGAAASERSFYSSSDGLFRVVTVESVHALRTHQVCAMFIASLRRVAEGVLNTETNSPVTFQFTGRPVFVAEIGGSMETEMSSSATGTLIVIALLFWLTHRDLKALAGLLGTLLLILGATIAVGGAALGAINVVSLGFAAILAGLAEDFGVVVYEEVTDAAATARAVRAHAAPGIWWSAITTAVAFFALNLSVLPGLRQLGSLVAIGVLLAAALMLYVYLPLVIRWKKSRACTGWRLFDARRMPSGIVVGFVTGAVGLAAIVSVLKFGIQFDRTPGVFRTRNSEATAALDAMKREMQSGNDPSFAIIKGASIADVGAKLERAEKFLADEMSAGRIASFWLPTALWIYPERQFENKVALKNLLERQSALEEAIISAGFNDVSLASLRRVFTAWRAAQEHPVTLWPQSAAANALINRAIAREDGAFAALGEIRPASPQAGLAVVEGWKRNFSATTIFFGSWEMLGHETLELVLRELPKLLLPIVALVLISLWLAYRSWMQVGLSVAIIAFAGLLLLGAMPVLGWKWNLLNIAAAPLLLGMGVDFCIHIQLAMQRNQGDILKTRQTVGRALLLAGTTTIVAFGSLAFSANVGMASLGQVCALGIALCLVNAVYVLPFIARFTRRKSH